MFNSDDSWKNETPVGTTHNLERIEARRAGDTGYMPDDCDGLDCPYYHQCSSDPEDYDVCPLMEWRDV